jgi:hypothetical protein
LIGNLHARITTGLNRPWRVIVHPHVTALGACHHENRKPKTSGISSNTISTLREG